jgi:uroporphyrinogen decarboxylase
MPTPRENLLRSMRRQGFDWVPVASGQFCPSQVEAFRTRFGHTDIAEHFGVPCRGVGVPLKRTFADPAKLFPREELPPDTDIDDFGVGHSHRPGCFHMTRMHHPLKGEVSLDEVVKYPLPVVQAGAAEKLRQQVGAIQARGLAANGSLACTVWETAWYLRSMEDLMVDMLSDDERATVLFDRVTDLACQRSRLYAQAGADIVELGDDIGMQQTAMMNPDLWRQWLKPRLARVIRETREVKLDTLIFYHSCGFVLPFLDDLIEVGVDILNPVQPECMDLADVHKLTKGRMSYWGTIGTQSTLPFGTPQEVRDVVKRNLDICGQAGGIVIAPTHMVEPEVPWENLEAMRLAAAEYRPA